MKVEGLGVGTEMRDQNGVGGLGRGWGVGVIGMGLGDGGDWDGAGGLEWGWGIGVIGVIGMGDWDIGMGLGD